MSRDPKERFTDRVADYVQHRPTYPAGTLKTLEAAFGFCPSWVVADIGSGTGLSSRIFLENGNAVFGVEPNASMRAAAERDLANYPKFVSVAGSAEESTLAADSVELVVAAQAFHWFDIVRARTEFLRIGGPGIAVALIWNDWRRDSSGFARGYDAALRRHCPEYPRVSGGWGDESRLCLLFGQGRFRETVLPNPLSLDRVGLIGRVLSASYSPKREDAAFPALERDLLGLFDQYSVGGRLEFPYTTYLYTGRLDP